MFAINHAATALVLKKKFPSVSMIWLLLSVQFIEMIWVILNFLGIEKTVTESYVNSVADIHLINMPFSHSIMMTLIIALIAWFVFSKFLNKPILGLAVGLGIISHIILDIFTHSADITIIPFTNTFKIGLGLYSIPILGFLVETLYGIWCWWYYKGNKTLLGIILFFNLSNISFFVSSIPGPEQFLANNPTLIVSLILIQIIVTLYLVGKFSSKKEKSYSLHVQKEIFNS